MYCNLTYNLFCVNTDNVQLEDLFNYPAMHHFRIELCSLKIYSTIAIMHSFWSKTRTTLASIGKRGLHIVSNNHVMCSILSYDPTTPCLDILL